MDTLMCWMLLTTLVVLVYTNNVAGTEITISRGSDIKLRLPGAECGKYTLLNGLLKPVLVIEKNVPKLLGNYRERANITESDSGYNLTIHDAGLQDDGRYKIASSRTECKDQNYYVTVRALTQEFLEQWSAWSGCTVDCDVNGSRSRTRNCSIKGGCTDMGEMSETQACDQADHCAHWTTWGSFGECSAKCGKGFKIRSRSCLKGSSSLLQTGDCVGPSIQSHMCMIVCEIVGVWTGWTEWGNCGPDCGVGRTRNRTRMCNDPRDTPNCPGNYTDIEDCGVIQCTDFRNETTNGTHSVNETEVADPTWLSELNLVVVLVMLGAITLILLIVIFMVIRRRRQTKRVNSTRLTRDTQVENATIDKRLTQANAKRPSRPDGVNVYSELGSSFCYNDSEFDDSEEDDPNTPETDNDTNTELETVKQVHDNSTNNAAIGQSGDINIAEINIYDNNTQDVNIQSQLRHLSNDSIYSDPPDEEDPDDEINPDEVFFESNVSGINETMKNSGAMFGERAGVNIAPVVRDQSGSPRKSIDGMYRKVNKDRDKPNKVEINHEKDVYYDPPLYSESTDPEVDLDIDLDEDLDDNVYENCDVKDGKTEILPIKSSALHSDNSESKSSIDEKPQTIKDEVKVKTQVTQSDIDIHPKLKESLEDVVKSDPPAGSSGDEDHIYMNDEIKGDMKNFYVLPRYSQHQQQPHIYDVPRSPT